MNRNLKVESVTVAPLKAPLIMPFRVATGSHKTLDNLLVTLRLTNGITGYGEAAVATHITGETLSETAKNLKATANLLKNYSIDNYIELSHMLKKEYPDNPCVRAAMEMSIFDALTKYLNIPLWKNFGPKAEKLISDITIVIGTMDETQKQTKLFYKNGFRAFKIKIGKDADLDLKRVAAVHAIVKDSKIYLDANQGFTAKQALTFLKELNKLNIPVDMIEQPVKRGDFEGLAKVTREGNVPVCADESARSLDDVKKIIKTNAANIINIKTMKTGFIESRDIAIAVKSAGLKLMIGGMMESSLSMTASAHLASGIGGFSYVDLDTPFFIKGEQQKNPFLSTKGIYTFTRTKPGIGITP